MHKVAGLYIEYIPLSKIKKWPRNPKLHSPELVNSINDFGFVAPGIIDERTLCLVEGHGRAEKLAELQLEGHPIPSNIQVNEDGEWCMPIVRGNHFQDDKSLERYLLSANLLTAAGGWDLPKLEEMLRDVTPYGSIELPEINIELAEPEEIELNEEENEEVTEEITNYDQAPFEIGSVLALKEEVYFYPGDDEFKDQCIKEYDSSKGFVTGANDLGIPNLRPDKLVQKLPEPLMTWGDRFNTPDDGKSWYLFNYGAVPIKELPNERCIFSFFAHDEDINAFWKAPAYRTGQLIRAFKVSMVIVPDFSLWQHFPKVLKQGSIYRAHWMGRYFQEAGLNLIPRLEFFDEESKPFSMAGVPVGAPVLATQFHTTMDDDSIVRHQKNLELAINLLQPKELLVYVSEKGKRVVEGANLSCQVVMLETAKKARKVNKHKETDPVLLDLRKRPKRDEFGTPTKEEE